MNGSEKECCLAPESLCEAEDRVSNTSWAVLSCSGKRRYDRSAHSARPCRFSKSQRMWFQMDLSSDCSLCQGAGAGRPKESSWHCGLSTQSSIMSRACDSDSQQRVQESSDELGGSQGEPLLVLGHKRRPVSPRPDSPENATRLLNRSCSRGELLRGARLEAWRRCMHLPVLASERRNLCLQPSRGLDPPIRATL